MKHLIITIIFVALFLATLIFTHWYIQRAKELADTRGYIRGYNYIKSISELQEQAGMESNECDGIWGSKTSKAYDQARNNQYAVKMFKKMSKSPSQQAIAAPQPPAAALKPAGRPAIAPKPAQAKLENE